MYLPTTREGMEGAIAWYIYRVKILGEPSWERPKKPVQFEKYTRNQI